jgi:hypothetical protein
MEQPPYELLSYVVRLSFRDPFGLEALFESYQRVRVSVAELRSVTHHIWGKGDQLHSYYSPSADLVRVKRADGKQVLVSALRQPAHAGDELDLYSTRQIHHGFKTHREGWEFAAFNPTHNARIAIRFPIAKEPKAMTVESAQGTPSPFVARPGTKEIIMTIRSPVPRSLYRIEWSW